MACGIKVERCFIKMLEDCKKGLFRAACKCNVFRKCVCIAFRNGKFEANIYETGIRYLCKHFSAIPKLSTQRGKRGLKHPLWWKGLFNHFNGGVTLLFWLPTITKKHADHPLIPLLIPLSRSSATKPSGNEWNWSNELKSCHKSIYETSVERTDSDNHVCVCARYHDKS